MYILFLSSLSLPFLLLLVRACLSSDARPITRRRPGLLAAIAAPPSAPAARPIALRRLVLCRRATEERLPIPEWRTELVHLFATAFRVRLPQFPF